MSNVFRIDDNFVDKPKRNVYDLSCQNNLTLNFGKLIPVLCKEALPGDGFRLEPTFGLRYLPQVFPVQTRQRANINYYYVRNRNLWKDWPDFIGKTKTGLTPPYLLFKGKDKNLLHPSSLADYFGVPIRIKPTMAQNEVSVKIGNPDFTEGNNMLYVPNGSLVFSHKMDDANSVLTYKSVQGLFYIPTSGSQGQQPFSLNLLYGAATANAAIDLPVLSKYPSILTSLNAQRAVGSDIYFHLYRIPITIPSGLGSILFGNPNNRYYVIYRTVSGTDVAFPVGGGVPAHEIRSSVTYNIVNDKNALTSITEEVMSIVGAVSLRTGGPVPTTPAVTASAPLDLNPNLCWCDVHYDDFPYASELHPDRIRISAIPFRACQSVYNALIRNAENNPLIVDGQPEYNKYILSDEGGATSPTDLLQHYHPNWSDDRFTTALPSPQQGNAPLVGLTGTQGATVVLGNEDGTQSTVHLKVDSNTGNVMMVEGVSSDSPEYLNDAMMSAVEYGITINDLRNVNAFQKWLENNIRKGYKYKDQLMSHYGVKARYDVLDMPEYLGGVARDVNVQQVTQTTENEYGNLGDIAGQSYIMGEGHGIENYCDEHGFIIGLMSVYPMPIYQDTLPKYLTKQDPFDYFFPEFGKIGPQPITNKELAFSQSFLEDNMDGTFGYQRAWYDYLESLDEVHGMYQDEFRNYLIARDFYRVPELGADFLTIDKDDLNNTFYSLDDKDKMLGQIYHKISVKRSIPLLGIPSIE